MTHGVIRFTTPVLDVASGSIAFNAVEFSFTDRTPPEIVGEARVGATLTAPGFWPSYQWYADGVAISGATSATFLLTAAQAGAMISIAVGIEIGILPSAPTGAVANPDFYVDSVAGSNANDGLTALTPKQTLTAAAALMSSNKHLALAKGSTWFETLDTAALSGVTVGTYGSGAPPIIDGSGVIPETWTRPNAGTYPNLWSVDHVWTFPDENQVQLPLMKNGVQLLRLTTDAAVNSTTGSYSSIYDEALTGHNPTPIRLYSTVNPNTDGNVYTVPVRKNVFQSAYGAGTGLTFSGIQTQNQGSNDGSAIFGVNSVVSQAIFRNGHKHNALIESGSITDFAVLDATDNGGIGVVFYSASGTGKSATFRRGMFMGRIGATSSINNTGIYSHTSSTPLDSITCEQCYFTGYSSAITTAVTDAQLDGCYVRNSVPFGLGADTSSIRYLLVRNDLYGGNTAQWAYLGVHSLTDSAWYTAASGQEAIRVTDNLTSVTLSDNTFVAELGASAKIYTQGIASTNTPTFNRNVFWSSEQPIFEFTATPALSADYNVYYTAPNFGSTQAKFIWNNIFITGLANWQAATGEDANSVYCRPADQVAGGTNAFWLGWAEAAGGTDLETVGPAIGDFRINPLARVYTGAEVAYIGTFADSTPLSSCGQQSHWDWNARAVASGPALEWPTVPTSLADAQDYITAPAEWVF